MTATPLDLSDIFGRVERIAVQAKALELAVENPAFTAPDDLARRAVVDLSMTVASELKEFLDELAEQLPVPAVA